MKIQNLLLLVGGLFLIGYYGNLGVAAATANFVFQGINFASLTDWVVTIQVQNVSNATVVIAAMDGTVYLNGDNIGSLSDFKSVTIPPTSAVNVQVHLSPSFLSLPGAIKDVTQLAGETLDFTVKGNANINGAVIPFSLDNPITF